MFTLVLLRHGESVWNKENKFAGWTDVDLTAQGMKEAQEAGRILKQKGFLFDISFTSYLKKAIRTLWIVLDEMDLLWIPMEKSWRLNERHYGGLQGMNRKEMVKKYGEKQVFAWRRSYTAKPPEIESSGTMYPGNDPRYKEIPKDQIPLAESLRDTEARLIPYWQEVIVPAVRQNKKVLIVAHGNSLRALVKHLDSISEDEISELTIPTGIPLVYDLDENLIPVRHYYVGDEKKIQKAIEYIAKQSKA